MKTIALTQNKFTVVDDEDYADLLCYKWYAYRTSRYTVYAGRTAVIGSKRRIVPMHRVIARANPGEHVDHVNGDGLDNRRTNLRVCTKAQNNKNRGADHRNKSGYKGVSWKKANAKWRAQIKADGVVVHLGLFNDIEQAARAYDAAAIRFHGSFARTNESLGKDIVR